MSWSAPSKRPCSGTDASIGQTHAILLAISYHILSYSDVFPKTVYIKYHTPHFSLSVTCFWLHPTFLLLVPEILIFIFFILTDVHHRFLLQLRSSRKKRGLHDEWYGNYKHAPTSAKILNQWWPFSFVLIKWSLEYVGSRRIMLAHVAPLKCPITKAPTLQASSWTGRPMSSRSTWGSAMEEDEIPYHLLMRWRHVRILKVVMETCEYSKNTYSTKLYRLYRSL